MKLECVMGLIGTGLLGLVLLSAPKGGTPISEGSLIKVKPREGSEITFRYRSSPISYVRSTDEMEMVY